MDEYSWCSRYPMKVTLAQMLRGRIRWTRFQVVHAQNPLLFQVLDDETMSFRRRVADEAVDVSQDCVLGVDVLHRHHMPWLPSPTHASARYVAVVIDWPILIHLPDVGSCTLCCCSQGFLADRDYNINNLPSKRPSYTSTSQPVFISYPSPRCFFSPPFHYFRL